MDEHEQERLIAAATYLLAAAESAQAALRDLRERKGRDSGEKIVYVATELLLDAAINKAHGKE